MSEPEILPPSPFAPVPLDPRERSGCRKAALGGCAFLFLLFIVASIVFVSRASDLLRWGLGLTEQQLAGRIAPDVPAEDRARLHAAFESARATLGTRNDPAALSAFQTKLFELQKKKLLGREDVAGLAAALEGMAGTAGTAGNAGATETQPTASTSELAAEP